jgi:hypothetical protein
MVKKCKHNATQVLTTPSIDKVKLDDKYKCNDSVQWLYAYDVFEGDNIAAC